nr:hypothetical protein [Tanacetum cinerariifolium]
MRRASKGYNGVEIPLFPTMLVQGQIDQGVESTVPVESHHTLTNALSTSQPPTLTPSMQTTYDAEEPATMSNDLPLLRVQSLGSTKLTYGAAYSKLILRVKKLEHKVKTSQHRRMARADLSDDEEDLEYPSKQERKIAEIDENPSILLVQDEGTSWIQEDYEIQERTSADTEILLDQEKPTELVEDLGSGEKGETKISTVIPEKKSKKQLEQERLGHEEAIRLQEQIFEVERQRIAKDAEIAKQLQEAIAEADSAHDIDWNDRIVLRYHALQNRAFFVAEKLVKRRMEAIVNQLEEVERKTVAKKRIGAKLDEESAKRQKLKDVTEEEATAEYEKEKEELRLSLKIIHNDDSEVNYEPLSKKFPIVSWEYQLMGKIEAKDMKVCKLTRADESSSYHGNIQAFLRGLDRQDLNDLYILVQESALVEINMLVEKKYPLIKELLEKMLNLQLKAEEESTMAFELSSSSNHYLKNSKVFGRILLMHTD